jgi:D-alanyl-D-alanine carboxypeptidase (penicillin-binding protein 5/6)
VSGLLAVAAVAYVVFALVRSLPPITVLGTPPAARFPDGRPRLAWPSHGEAAVGVEGLGLIGSHGSNRSTAIASVAKVMTAYVVLHDHPLRGHGGGPEIMVTRGDVATYRADNAAGQSVVLVRAGERLTERQALEGFLLPSGNNIATLVAGWDAGSQRAFVAKMNADARALGLRHTRYRDASGVRGSTVSTASDQVRLAMRAMRIAAFRQTVALAQATLPVAGRQFNTDALIGRHGIVGIKTGTTSQAGGCFVFAARERVGGRSMIAVGAVLHQAATPPRASIIASAFAAASTLLASTRTAVLSRRVVKRGARVAWVRAPWADRVSLRASRSASLVGWAGLRVRATIAPPGEITAPVTVGQDVGAVVLAAGRQRKTVRLISSGAVPAPSLTWRLSHP